MLSSILPCYLDLLIGRGERSKKSYGRGAESLPRGKFLSTDQKFVIVSREIDGLSGYERGLSHVRSLSSQRSYRNASIGLRRAAR
jgi:hypothetical protein